MHICNRNRTLDEASDVKKRSRALTFQKSDENGYKMVKNSQNGKMVFFTLCFVINIIHIANVDNMWVLHSKYGQT